MTGLLLKDYLTMKKYFRTLGIIIFIYIIWAVCVDNISFFVWFIPILLSMSTFNTFVNDDTCKWNEYAISFPIKRNQFVFSKYVFSVLLVLFGNICSILFMFLYSVIKSNPAIISEIPNTIAGTFLLSLTFISIVIPAIIILGIEKARIAVFGIFLIPSILVFAILKASPTDSFLTQQKIEQLIEFLFANLPIISFIFCTVVLSTSCFISCKAFSKKEF